MKSQKKLKQHFNSWIKLSCELRSSRIVLTPVLYNIYKWVFQQRMVQLTKSNNSNLYQNCRRKFYWTQSNACTTHAHIINSTYSWSSVEEMLIVSSWAPVSSMNFFQKKTSPKTENEIYERVLRRFEFMPWVGPVVQEKHFIKFVVAKKVFFW